MGKVTVDIIGLAVLDSASGKAIFLNDPEPKIVGVGPEGKVVATTDAVPAHFAFVAVPLIQQNTKDPIRERFRFYNDPSPTRPFGFRALHAWYLLSRDKVGGQFQPQFVEIGNVTATGATGTIETLLSVSDKLVPQAKLKAGVTSGQHDLVAALFDISKAQITPIEDQTAKIKVRNEELPSIPVVRLVYATTSTPTLLLRQGNTISTITLDDGAHLIAGVVPLEEIVNLQAAVAPGDLMKHFDLIYELFDLPPDAERPLPQHVHPPNLAPPGQCGPPVRP